MRALAWVTPAVNQPLFLHTHLNCVGEWLAGLWSGDPGTGSLVICQVLLLVRATVDTSSSLLQEAAAGVKGINVYFDNDFLMRLQTNKINSLGCIFNSRSAVGSVPGG